MKAYSIKKIINKNVTKFPSKMLITLKKPSFTDFQRLLNQYEYTFGS